MLQSHCSRFNITIVLFILASVLLYAGNSTPKKIEPGLLFYLSGSNGFKADYSAGKSEPNFLRDVTIIPKGAKGPAFKCADTQLMSYWAPGNIFAERGTLSFFWRSREQAGKTEFPIFRVGYADHSSWDMVWLRIDYNGHGFDAFVTDANLARVRVSTTLAPFPPPDKWIHIALEWDETIGIRFYIDGKLAAQKDSVVVLYTGLDQFGPHSRVISPAQVQSAYNFVRGGDIDEIKIYDRMIGETNINSLAKGMTIEKLPAMNRSVTDEPWKAEWQLRFGWNRTGDLPPYLDKQSTSVRKVEIKDVYDLKRWWWKGTDGIRETTWPGVYNRSRLPGRNDYFQLPDWDCYSLSGRNVTFMMPNEPWNHLEISGSAFGNLSLTSGQKRENEQIVFRRVKGQEKTFHRISHPIIGRNIRFTNTEQEMPIGELSAYNVDTAVVLQGASSLSYSFTSAQKSDTSLHQLMAFINGRFMADERATMVAVPGSVKIKPLKKKKDTSLPIVHLLIPCNSFTALRSKVKIDSTYDLDKIDGGLDGFLIELPALNIKPTQGGLIPLNIQIKDPLWPMRNMLDFSFSVKPNEARTLYLDTRDRILPKRKNLYLTLASAEQEFGMAVLEGMKLRLIFKPYKEAMREHIQDRFTQVKDNFANLVEERADDPRLNLSNRFEADIIDLLKVDSLHYPGQNYWYDHDRRVKKPAFIQPVCSDKAPLWAFRQLEDLRYFKRFVLWWIDHRQISNGELGGGLSDDDDLTNCWPGLALMGCESKKISDALLRMLDAMYQQEMFTNGLPTIQTDGLHAHEEGIEAQAQTLLVNYGSPKQLERIMETVRALDEKIMLKNTAGHRHFRSSYFSGAKIADESVWEWSLQAQQFLLMQPVLNLAIYNGNPRAKQLAIDMADGLLAHARKDSAGKIILDSEINFSSDSARPSPLGNDRFLFSSMGPGGTFNTATSGLQLLWAVYRMTGDQKYLQPLLDLGENILAIISNNGLDLLDKRSDWGALILRKAAEPKSPDLYKHIAWQMTGDKKYLEQYYADQIEETAIREYINTEGSLWTDRVFAANRELQRSRLGGIALVRGMNYSGHAVSWNFKAPATEESAAILIPDATPTALKILVYVPIQESVTASIIGWDVEPGMWEIKQGLDLNGDEQPDTIISTQTLQWGRSEDITFCFPPRENSVLMFKHITLGLGYDQRPDLGMDKGDVQINGCLITATIHSLGAIEAPESKLELQQNGRTIASVSIPAIPAPFDLIPKNVSVVLTAPVSADIPNCVLQIVPNTNFPEITKLNNRIELKEITNMKNYKDQKLVNDEEVTLPIPPRVEHIAFNVSDPIAMAKWYCENFKMKIIRKSPPPVNAHFLADAGGNVLIEIYSNTTAPIPDYSSINHMSLHFAIQVKDIQATRDLLLTAGAKIVEDITTTPANDKVLMLRDPWGLALQLVQRSTAMLNPKDIRPEHLAINVSDPQLMTNWYVQNLSMQIVRSGSAPTFTNFFSDAGKNMMMEVYSNAQYPMLDFHSIHQLSLHYAMVVDDIRTVRNGLITAGATLLEDIKVTNTGDEVLMLRDPWGLPIQFLKRAMPMVK